VFSRLKCFLCKNYAESLLLVNKIRVFNFNVNVKIQWSNGTLFYMYLYIETFFFINRNVTGV
jgi:hypothetical protein